MVNLFQDFLNWTGSNNTSGNQYGFWSGFGSDLGELTIIGALLAGYKHHNCAVKGCPRFGTHKVDGTKYKTCHKHTTLSWHAKLQQDHSDKFPEQHKLLNLDEEG